MAAPDNTLACGGRRLLSSVTKNGVGSRALRVQCALSASMSICPQWWDVIYIVRLAWVAGFDFVIHLSSVMSADAAAVSLD